MKYKLLFVLSILFVTLSLKINAENENSEEKKDQIQSEKFQKEKDEAESKDISDKLTKRFGDKYFKGKNIGFFPSVMYSQTRNLQGNKVKHLEIHSEKGEIKPDTASVILEKEDHQEARKLAKAFLIENAKDFLDINDINDIREYWISTDTNVTGERHYTYIYFNQYIGNLKFADSRIHITTLNDEGIYRLEADIPELTPELLEAVKKETLSEDAIGMMIADDFSRVTGLETPPTWKSEAKGVSKKTNAGIPAEVVAKWESEVKGVAKDFPRIGRYPRMKIEKVAISVPPYVIYKVDSLWDYTIDAFTGEILRKLPTWKVD